MLAGFFTLQVLIAFGAGVVLGPLVVALVKRLLKKAANKVEGE